MIITRCTISHEQSAFIENRSILDNIMAAMETIHRLKCKTLGKVAFKIDISKASDWVDRRYLNNVMEIMGFCSKWIEWTSMCLESVQFSILMNGELAWCYGVTKNLHGVTVCGGAPTLSHMLFADDSFLFFRANEREAKCIQNILSTYERTSGQAINMVKSGIFYSKNTLSDMSETINNLFGVTKCLGTDKYLGMPSMIGGQKYLFLTTCEIEYGRKFKIGQESFI